MPIDEVVLAAQAGDADAFATLYARHSSRVFSQIRRMVKSEADAEELAQEVWLHVWKKIGQFQGKASFATWLYRVAFNFVLMSFRDAKSGKRIPAEALIAYDEGYADELPPQYAARRVTDPELHIDLVRAISKLAPGHRHALIDHYVYGDTHEEIAWATGVTEGSSKSQAWKAREKVKEMLTCPTRF